MMLYRHTNKVFYGFCIALLGLIVCTSSCMEQASSEVLFNKTVRDSSAQAYFKTELTKITSNNTLVDALNNKSAEAIKKDFKTFYELSKDKLVWQNIVSRGPSKQITNFIEILTKEAPTNGLSVNNYQLKKIEDLYHSLYVPNLPESIDHLEKMVELEFLLTTAALAYSADLLNGAITHSSRWEVPKRPEKTFAESLIKAIRYGGVDKHYANLTPKYKGYALMQAQMERYLKAAKKGGLPKINGTLSKGKKGDKVKNLIDYLVAVNDLPADKANTDTYNEDVVNAVKKYQKRHYIPISGAVDNATVKALNIPVEERIEKLALNLERYRWLPDPETLGERYVWANIPEFILKVYEEQEKVAEIVVVVGDLKNATPVMVGKKMQNIIFSPTWTLPQSIAQEEMEFILKNPAVLVVADVDVWIDGKKVNPMEVDWKNIGKKKVKMRQRPKNTNSMGKAKFQFANNHGIYLHDTPNQLDFTKRSRAYSHGCLRVKEPKQLAVTLLKGSNWNKNNITSAMASNKEQYAKLPKETNVHIYYMTAWVDDDGEVQFRNDVYGYDKRQLKALAPYMPKV